MLENRQMLAVINDVSVTLSAGVLSIIGDQFGNTVSVTTRSTTNPGTPNTVAGGQTNIRLDTTLLNTAGLEVTGSSSTLSPASGFTVSYPITGGGFTYNPTPFAAQAGSINHTGSVTFNDGQVIVSGLRIAFDTNRVSEDMSGFYVIGTVDVNNQELEPTTVLADGEVILFDVGAPDAVTATSSSLRVGEADLLVAPELVAALDAAEVESTAAAGTDVGDVLIDGNSNAASSTRVVVTSSAGTFINGSTASTRRTFDIAGVRSIRAALGGGSDALVVSGLDAPINIFVRTGPASDSVSISNSTIRGLDVNLGSGSDSMSVSDIITTGDQRLQGGADFDRFTGRLFDLRASLFASFGEVDIQDRRTDGNNVG
jgi:hypothetical protein